MAAATRFRSNAFDEWQRCMIAGFKLPESTYRPSSASEGLRGTCGCDTLLQSTTFLQVILHSIREFAIDRRIFTHEFVLPESEALEAFDHRLHPHQSVGSVPCRRAVQAKPAYVCIYEEFLL